MDAEKAISVNIINRSYPPYSGITGESAFELAAFLIQRGVNVNAIHVAADYRIAPDAKSPAGTSHKIKTFYNGKSKILRLFSNLYEGFQMIRKSNSLDPDVTICMTEPPFLSIWAAILMGKKRKWMLWSMDLYPEALAASGLASKNNFIYRWLDNRVVKNPPQHIIALGKHQGDYLAAKFRKPIPQTLLPCGIYPNDITTTQRPSWADTDKILLGYCGNLGEAHSPEFVMRVIDHLDSSKYKLILVLYGSKAAPVLEYAKGKSGVHILPFVSKQELHFIEVHLASLVPEWIDVCVPSKTVSSVCAGASFLYYGMEDSDNWMLLQEAGWILHRNEDLETTIPAFLNKLTREDIRAKKESAIRLSRRLLDSKQRAFEQIYQVMRSM